MRKLVHDGLEMLSELELRPPLPRTVHGRVVLQHFDENDNPQCKPMPGFQVELGGIASPAQDKMENHEDLQCFCGADGCFTLVMPDRYNMQETVTFTVSENPNAPEVLRRKLLLGGTGPRSMTFTRRASELIDAARISVTIEEPVRDAETMTGAKLVTKSFSLPEIFAKLNRFSALERQVNQQADAWAEEEANRKKRAELNAELGDFLILEEAFAERAAKPAALPSVRLMGEGKNATYLPTDTAPSRMFRYGMIQRLVEPEIRVYDEKSGSFTTVRGRISEPLDVYKFQQGFYADPEKAAIACSLGMGYAKSEGQNAACPDCFRAGAAHLKRRGEVCEIEIREEPLWIHL